MSSIDLDVVILAAGQGTRMRSSTPKVLHTLAGRSLLQHVIDTAETLTARNVAVVVGHQADTVQGSIDADVRWVQQPEQLGTGHAVQLAMSQLPGDGVVVVLYGDVPLISVQVLTNAIESAKEGSVGLVVADFADPAELGRIVRNEAGEIQRIVEFKDADQQERSITEINSGILAVPGAHLQEWLGRLKPNNKQGEYYLTDIIAMAVADGVAVEGVMAHTPEEVAGINDRVQLAALERYYQQREAERLMRAGVTIADPTRLDIRGSVEAGEDCFLDVNVVLQGKVVLGKGVRIGPGSVVTDAQIGDFTEVHAHTLIEDASIAAHVSVGPFARVRPGSVFAEGVRIGNFVETKKAQLGAGSKANHLAYLGDTVIGEACNVGAGSVTCNYDGVNKHSTNIGDNVFVGTNSTLVAPLDIHDGAFVAAGSTVTSTVDKDDLAVGRGKQRNIKGWVRPDKRKE
ncbi:MAG: bifunctional UDP-N-acetylglucosamine diphosphorylase/glucosamine-1-phosphate N-acetyltransferase GlmU [Pseudomonadota bacterium]